MANYSKEELQYIASQVQPYLLELVKANGLDVDSIEIVEDTDGITSLPAYDNRGGVKKIVRVPISTFSKPAQDVADSLAESLALVQEAVTKADEAVTKAEAAVDGIEDIRNDIEQAVSDAQKALEDVREAAETVTAKVEEINTSEGAREEAELLRQNAEAARVTEFNSIKQNMDASIEEMDAATESALDTANHPTYVGTDNYVYVWNKENKVYNKTDIYVKGDKGEQGLQGEQGPQGPKGENGTGSGNVLVSTTNLQKGKKYLFIPTQNASAEGTFVEYEVPTIDLSEIATKEELESKQDKITDLEAIRTGANKGSTAYQKPTNGVPKTDLSSAVQTSLGKADTALQSYTEQYKGTVTGVKINGSTKTPISGTVDLGTVITSHQSIKTINGNTITGSGNVNTEYPVTTVSGSSVNMKPNTYYRLTTGKSSLTITFQTPTYSGIANEYVIEFVCGGTVSMPNTIIWANGKVPTFEVGNTYVLSVVNNLGIVVKFVQV